MLKSTVRAAVPAVVSAVAIAISGCGSDDESSQSGSASASASQKDAAAAAIKPFVGQPSAFPVTEPLKRVPKGATLAFMDCGTPVCALFWDLLVPAAKTMGVKLTRVKAGQQASTVSAAFDTVVSQKPDAVLVTAIDPELWKNPLKELQAAKIPVITNGIVEAEDFGIKAPGYARNETARDGKLLADYVVSEFGDKSKVALYVVPELPLTVGIAESFEKELKAICPACSQRRVEIAVSTLGNTAPNRIVSDLQTNPDSTVAVFSTDEIETGLPSALQAADIDIKTLGNVPTPTNLQYIKEGKQTAALATDLPVMMWSMVDKAARFITGQEPVGDQAKGLVDVQFLTKADIKFDPAKGWTGYPDFAQRYAKLWGVAK